MTRHTIVARRYFSYAEAWTEYLDVVGKVSWRSRSKLFQLNENFAYKLLHGKKRFFVKRKLQGTEINRSNSKDSWENYCEVDNSTSRWKLMESCLVSCQNVECYHISHFTLRQLQKKCFAKKSNLIFACVDLENRVIYMKLGVKSCTQTKIFPWKKILINIIKKDSFNVFY